MINTKKSFVSSAENNHEACKTVTIKEGLLNTTLSFFLFLNSYEKFYLLYIFIKKI